jgi:hypothetical protein
VHGCRDTGWRQGSKALGVARIDELSASAKGDSGDGQFYLSHGGCILGRVI